MLLYYITYCQPLSAIHSVILWWEKHVFKANNWKPENKKQLEDSGLRMPDMDLDIKQTAGLQQNQS